MPKSKKPAPKKPAAKAAKPLPQRRSADMPQRRSTDKPQSAEALMALDAGYQAARQNAVSYLHGRRQAVFALARRYHLEPDDIQQEGYEILLTCLRDFQPLRKNAETGETSSVQFNTFFGSRLEGKAMELRNRDPEYQARQAHTADMSDADRSSFRSNPPLLVQHLDHQGTMQEHLQSEVSGAQRARVTNVKQKVLQDSYIDRKLTELIAAERDEQRRAALLQLKVGGLSTFDDIAYQFGVTDSRASQILNDLMDAFYIQRLLDGDLASVAYDFRKQKLNEKRALRLLAEAINNAPPPRAQAISDTFKPDYPEVTTLLAARGEGKAISTKGGEPTGGAVAIPADQSDKLFAKDELKKYPPVEITWKNPAELTAHPLAFRGVADAQTPSHITRLLTSAPEHWPLIVNEQGVVIDGVRRLAAAQKAKLERVLCHVHHVPDNETGSLRVVLNMRAIHPEKLELYFAIAALLKEGLSQGKVATALNTSRPNVIVYAKVAEKASPDLRQLFEDGLIQVTNASAAVDLPVPVQAALSRALRVLGVEWSKGPKFAELFAVAESDKTGAKLDKYLKSVPHVATSQNGALATSNGPNSSQIEAVAGPQMVQNGQLRSLQNALIEAETWATRRDATITQQTSEITELKEKIGKLSSELEAAQLLSQADKNTMAAYLKELKLFHTVSERLQAASHHLQQASKPLRSMPLNTRPVHEIQELCAAIAGHLTALRLSLQRPSR